MAAELLDELLGVDVPNAHRVIRRARDDPLAPRQRERAQNTEIIKLNSRHYETYEFTVCV